MLFTSITFLFLFLPIVVTVNLLIKNKYSNLWLLLCSLFFYVWGEPYYFWVIFISIIVNFYLTKLMYNIKLEKSKKIIFTILLVFNFSILIYYKYYNFFINSVNNQIQTDLPLVINQHLPIGISFFTFHLVTYVVDIYTQKVTKPIKKLSDLSLYILLFPHAIAGPIIQYNEIFKQVLSKRKIKLEKFTSGVLDFIIGMGKKVLIANNVSLVSDQVFNSPSISSMPSILVFLGVLAYCLQIYFDFSGYTQMAIGIARMLGFDFPENFNYPYVSRSIKEFWQRWHITLGNWFKHYLYIPLGGNRKGKLRTNINLMIVFALTGIWHGANWTFVIWGLLNGLLIVIESLFLGKYLQKFRVISHIYLLTNIFLLWVLFRADTLGEALEIIKKLTNISSIIEELPNLLVFLNKEQLIFMIIGLVFSTPIVPRIVSYLSQFNNISFYYNIMQIFKNIILVGIMGLCLVYIISNSYNPFIYFRF